MAPRVWDVSVRIAEEPRSVAGSVRGQRRMEHRTDCDEKPVFYRAPKMMLRSHQAQRFFVALAEVSIGGPSRLVLPSMTVKIEVPRRADQSSTRSEFVALESILVFEPDPLNLELVGIAIHGSQLATGPIEDRCDYCWPPCDEFESPLARRWVLRGPFECEPRQNKTFEKGAPVPPGKTIIPGTA